MRAIHAGKARELNYDFLKDVPETASENSVNQTEQEQCFSTDEAIAAFGGLSTVEKRNLTRLACTLARGKSRFASPDELINEAYVRIGEGRRCWPKDVAFVRFFSGVMQSLLTDRMFLTDERKVVALKHSFSVVTSEELDGAAASDDDEERARKAQLEFVLSKLEAHFGNDEEMRYLMLGIQEGLRGKALQDAIGVDTKRLEALRTRLNRQIEKLAVECDAMEGRPS